MCAQHRLVVGRPPRPAAVGEEHRGQADLGLVVAVVHDRVALDGDRAVERLAQLAGAGGVDLGLRLVALERLAGGREP